MAIPPQFIKKGSKAKAAEDAKDGGKDDANEDSNGNLKKKGKSSSHKGAPPKDSKDPKGAPFDAIPSGPMKGQNPFQLSKGNAKRKLLLQQAAKGGK